MLIKSKFKDYYDIVAHTYGVDNKIVFDRNIEIPEYVDVYVPDENIVSIPSPFEYLFDYGPCKGVEEKVRLEGIDSFGILSVCGKPFIVGHSKSGYDNSCNRVIPPLYLMPSPELFNLLMGLHCYKGIPALTEPRRYLLKISQQIKSPIFMMHSMQYWAYRSPNVKKFELHQSVPCLASIKGFAKLYSAEQVYQDVSYWISNVMNGAPDVQPIGSPPLTDKERILSHGFDLKQSFRHRLKRKLR